MNSIFNYFEQFMPLSTEAKALLATTVEYVEFPKNSKILSIGNHNKYMYVIKKGIVRGYKINDRGDDITLSLWMENDTFGDITTYITGQPLKKSYEALEDVIAYSINIKQFRELFALNHEICNLGRLIIESFVVKTEMFKDSLRDSTARERLQFFITHRPGLVSRVKLKYIASYLDISSETLSRIRH
jgi:CRP/FNR family transcriptional regulator, anaerobic regulatory protein